MLLFEGKSMPVNMFLEQSQKADKWSGSTIEANLFKVN